jgi:hypothetical protein
LADVIRSGRIMQSIAQQLKEWMMPEEKSKDIDIVDRPVDTRHLDYLALDYAYDALTCTDEKVRAELHDRAIKRLQERLEAYRNGRP